MRISEALDVDVREPLTAQRRRLIGLLASLGDEQWGITTAAPQWTVKDVTLHLLGGELSWLARNRDRETAGIVPPSSSHDEFVRRMDRHNQMWVDGSQALSPRLIIGLLHWSGEQFDGCLRTVDLCQPSQVYWAGDAPLWFDLAREFTERWVHYWQIRESVRPEGNPGQDEYLSLVLRTFIWGFPHQYRVPAPVGTTVTLDIADTGTWTLTRRTTGWDLDEGRTGAAAALLHMTGDAAWRLLTGARYDPSQVQLSGDSALTIPLLRVRSIVV